MELVDDEVLFMVLAVCMFLFGSFELSVYR